MKKLIVYILLYHCIATVSNAQKIQNLKITILSTMLADTVGKGEWGFSALVEADGNKMLFDAGTDSNLVLDNAKQWGIDLSDVPVFIFSHSHGDHTGGWHTIQQAYAGKNPSAFATAFVGAGFFETRYNADHSFQYSVSPDSSSYISSGGAFKVCSGFTEIYPGIFLTGPVPRKYPEETYDKDTYIHPANRFVMDDVHEDMSLVISTTKGLVLLSGCGHSGIINTISYIQQSLAGTLYAAIGGFHLLNENDQQIKWTAEQLKKAGIQYFIGAHCTGINAVYDIRQLCGLSRKQCVVGTVGCYFDLAKGIVPGYLAK